MTTSSSDTAAGPLNSRTSGVDGSSEGGRINTENQFNTLSLYALALLEHARRELGYSAPLTVTPTSEDGTWFLAVKYGDGKQGDGNGVGVADIAAPVLPETWHGRRVVVERMARVAPAATDTRG